MSAIRNFILANDIQPGDAIKAKKVGWEILDHYAVYVGQDGYGEHYFMANSMTHGVRYYDETETEQLLREFFPKQIKRFIGDDSERQAAINRAVNEEGKKYNLLGYNCEHFCNLVQSGKKYSKQVNNVGLGLAASLFIVGLSKSN